MAARPQPYPTPLPIASNQILNAGSNIWEIAGYSTSSSPFLINGTFTAQTSTFKYTTDQDTNITNATYYSLELAPPSAAYTFSDGFETNDFSQWSEGSSTDVSGSAVEATSTYMYRGNYAMASKGGGANGYGKVTHDVNDSNTTVYSRFYIFFPTGWSFGSSTYTLLSCLTTSAWNTVLQLSVEDWGGGPRLTSYYRDSGGGSNSIDTGYTFTTNTWHSVESKLVINSSSGEVQIWVDGDEKNHSTSIDTGTTTIKYFEGGAIWTDGAHDFIYQDDFVYDDERIGEIPTYTLGTAASQTVTVNNNLLIGSGTGLTVTGATNNPVIDVNGNITISTSTAFTAPTSSSFTAGGNWTNSGTFTHSDGTVTFDAGASGKTITTGGSDFYNLTFNNGSGGWTFQDAATTTNDLTITQGTVSSAYNMTVQGGDAAGNGTLNWTAGTFLVDGTGNFGGTSAWTFYDLTFGDGAGTATTTSTGSATTTISNTFTIASNQILNAGSNIWEIAGHSTSSSPFIVNGTFTAQTSTFKYTTDYNTNITDTTYYNLELASPVGGARIFSDGFETNDFSKWDATPTTSGSTVETTSVYKNSDDYGMKFQVGGVDGTAYAYEDTNSGETTIYTRFYIYFPAGWDFASSTGINILSFTDSSWDDRLALTAEDWGSATPRLAWTYWDSTQGSHWKDGNIYLSLGDWHYIETKLVVNSSSGAVTIWVDDSKVVEETSLNTGSTDADIVSIGCSWADDTHDFIYQDDFVYDDEKIGRVPVYTLGTAASQTVTVNNNLSISGTDLTVTGATNNPTLDVNGNITISASSTLVAATSSSFTAGGNWTNSGTFTHSTSTVTFDSVSSGKTITTGGSGFYNLTFNNGSGGWTLSAAATTTNNFTITNGSVTSTSATLTVGGSYSNSGTFTHNSGTVLFNATASGKTITDGGSAFHLITFNGSGGEWLYTNGCSTAPATTTVQNGTPTFLNAKAGNTSVSSGALNVDWYLGAHIVNKDATSTNIDTGDSDVTVSEHSASPAAVIWRYGGGWGNASTTQTTGTGSDGKNPQPTSAGAIRIREYSKTSATTTYYKYNLQVSSQAGFGSYNYYSDQGSKYLTATGNTGSGNDECISVSWYRSSAGTMNTPYSVVNEQPTNGSWYIGMSADLEFSVNLASVDLGTLNDGNNYTATGTTITYTTTTAANGYIITAWAANSARLKLSGQSIYIDAWTGTNATPTAWTGNCVNNSECGFGYTTDDNTLSGGTAARFATSTNYAGFATTQGGAEPVADETSAVPSGSQHTISYKVSVSDVQNNGAYDTNVYYICTAQY